MHGEIASDRVKIAPWMAHASPHNVTMDATAWHL